MTGGGRALLKGDLQASTLVPLTLGELWRRYSTECAAHLDNTATSQRGAADSARVLLGYFGADCRVDKLDEDEQRAFERDRRAGGIRLPGSTTAKRRTRDVTRPVRARTAERDVQHLHIMLRWAVRKGLLTRKPLDGVPRTREKNKKQPVAPMERYEATVAAMRELRAQSESETERVRWLRIELALFLAEQTGRRLGAIRQLRWDDFEHEAQVVHWRAEADKKGKAWRTNYSPDFFKAVWNYQREIGAVAGQVLADPKASDGIIERSMFDYLLKAAEAKAGLPKLDGSLWHAYRRKWATERMHLPPKAVATSGGWSDVNTLLQVYQQPDEARSWP